MIRYEAYLQHYQLDTVQGQFDAGHFGAWLMHAIMRAQIMLASGLIAHGINLAAVEETELQFSADPWSIGLLARVKYRRGADHARIGEHTELSSS